MIEFLNRLLRSCNRFLHNWWFKIVTVCNKTSATIIGVKISRHVRFNGWTSFFRATDSKIQIGSNCTFNSSCYANHIGLNHRCIITTMTKEASIRVGRNTGMSSTTITSWDSIDIGENVRIGANCVIMDGDFHLDDPRTPRPSKIQIGNNVWLGANVVVLKGVTIGDNSIIGMNSVVTKDIPANCVAVGSPCKMVRSIQNDDKV